MKLAVTCLYIDFATNYQKSLSFFLGSIFPRRQRLESVHLQWKPRRDTAFCAGRHVAMCYGVVKLRRVH